MNNAKVGSQPSLEITLKQAESLVAFFGGHDAEVTIMERPADWQELPEGLYAYCTEYPDEGSVFLGATVVDEDLADNGRPEKPSAEQQTQRITELEQRIAKLEKELEQCRPKWKVCPECMGRGKHDVAHGVTEDCSRCEGKGVIAAKPQTNVA